MEKEQTLFLEICKREWREIDMTDHRAGTFGDSFKRMNMTEMERYLNFSQETARLKHELRKEVGWLKYYFIYTFKFIILNWLGIHNIVGFRDDTFFKKVKDLETELVRMEQYIGALYDYLEVRPQRTFIEDYSRLPSEVHPTREIIKCKPVARKK